MPHGGRRAARPVRHAIVKALSDAGVPLLIGTDTMAAGYNVHQELALFVESGLSPYQTLVAATAEPARYFDAEGEFCLLYTSPSPRDATLSRMPSSA